MLEQVADLSGKEIDINRQIELTGHQIRHILDQKGLLKNILGIVAFGSLARGEGLITKYDDGVKILSDLDLALISQDKRISAYRISTEIPKISRILRCPFKVSMGVIKLRDFNAFRTLLFLDIKQSGKVLFGSKRLLSAIDIGVNKVPLWEGVRLIFNNGIMQLLQVFNFDNPGVPLETVYACNKAYLACCDALLLLAGTYPPTILQRSELFKRIYSANYPVLFNKIPFLSERVKQSAKVRTQSKPWRVPPLRSRELSQMWFEARRCCIETLRVYMARYFRLPTRYPNVLDQIRLLSLRRRASMLYDLLKRQKPFSAIKMLFVPHPPIQTVNLAALLLVEGINLDGTVNPDYLQAAQNTLHAACFLHGPRQKKSLSECWLTNKDKCIELWKGLPQMMIYKDNEIEIES